MLTLILSSDVFLQDCLEYSIRSEALSVRYGAEVSFKVSNDGLVWAGSYLGESRGRRAPPGAAKTPNLDEFEISAEETQKWIKTCKDMVRYLETRH